MPRRVTGNFSTTGTAPATEKPNIAYCTIVYVDETDQKAIDTALFRASRAYEGFMKPAQPGESFAERAKKHSEFFKGTRRAGRLGDHVEPVRS